MTITGLIKVLEEILQKQGDMEVIVHDTVNGDSYDVCSVGPYFESQYPYMIKKTHIEI